MGLFEVESPVDKWAEWDDPLFEATLSVLSICLFFSMTLFAIRVYQVAREDFPTDLPMVKTLQIRLLQASHLFAMFFSSLYIFFHLWNYAHLYIEVNPMECDAWFEAVMTSITLSKNFIYLFLMLRSSLAFDTGLFRIPLPLSVAVIVIAIIGQWTLTLLMITDYTAISPFPDNGFCFRILGEDGEKGINGYNFFDASCAFIALIIFWWKARAVSQGLLGIQAKGAMDSEFSAINEMFKKHILLGVFILIGSILIWFGGEFMSLLMGIAGALHLTCNNFYLFLFFKPNEVIYKVVCCKKRQKTFKENAKNMQPSTAANAQPSKLTVITNTEGQSKLTDNPSALSVTATPKVNDSVTMTIS